MTSSRRSNRHPELSWTYRLLDAFRLAANFFKRHPLRGQSPYEHSSPFFIIGSGRSGTTLLRAILVVHEELAIPPESYVLGTAIREYYRFSFLPWHVLARLVISRFEGHAQFSTWGVNLQPLYQQSFNLPPQRRNLSALLDLLYRYYIIEKKPGAKRWGDKTPLNTFYLDEIDRVFPTAQYIHMIRDGRDVTASYLRAELYEELPQAAQRWLRSIESAQRLALGLDDDHYIEIRYESLVRQPEAVVCRICQFLGISYKASMLDFWQSTEELGDAEAAHHANLRNSINTNSIGKWRSFFSDAEKTQLHKLVGPKLKELGYQ